DARFDRPLAQEVGAEAVNRAQVGFFEALDGLLETSCGIAARCGLDACALELFAQPQLQLAGSLLAERHRDDLRDLGPARLNQADDAPDELGRLAGPGSGFDDQRVVERLADQMTIVCSQPAHDIFLSASRSATSGLRSVRRSSSGPHTGRKSQ